MGSFEVALYQTCRDTPDRLTRQRTLRQGKPPAHTLPSITVDPRTSYQVIEGFGGAFTEAAAVTFYRMPPEARAEILRAYFDPHQGHGYILCRTHINSCDFSTGNYACSEVDGDFDLKHFSIAREKQAIIPMIKEAASVAGVSLQLFASPWSPPAWMKTTHRMNRGGKLRPECRATWAQCYCRFIEAFAAEGIPFWGLSVQNEPEAISPWDNCLYTGEEERDFVRDYLGPALEAHGLSHIKLMVWDHNRDRMFERAKTVYDDPRAAKYVWGPPITGMPVTISITCSSVHEAWPEKHLLFTEGCQEDGPHLGSWTIGERYGHALINDLNRWSTGWVDWNLLLNEQGGPNHVGNFCSAPLIADTRTGRLHYLSSYYYLGHFARFVRPGARRILAAATRDALEITAFLNTDGAIAVVVMNRSEDELPFALNCRDITVQTRIPRRAIQTYLLPAE